MRYPLDLGGWEILVAIGLLVVATVALSVIGALGARAVDRLWDQAGAVGRTP